MVVEFTTFTLVAAAPPTETVVAVKGVNVHNGALA